MEKQQKEEEAEESAYSDFLSFLSDWEKQGAEIIDRQFQAECSRQNCSASGAGIVRGNFISYQEILEEEWKTEYEYSGDNP